MDTQEQAEQPAKSANDALHGFKVILYFTQEELLKVEGILRELKMIGDPNIILIDARSDQDFRFKGQEVK